MPPAAKSVPLVRRISLRMIAVVAFFGVLWFILWRQLSGEWSVNDQYSYGWFVPFFALLLFWLRWQDRPEIRKEKVGSRKQAVAVGVAAVALLLLFPIRLFEIGNPDWRPLSWLHALCVVTITLAVLWSIGGMPWVRHFAFPILFTLVAVPWISPVEMPIIEGLMRIIAAVAAETANLLGIPAQVQGNLIHVSTGLIGVNEACSGVRSLQTSLMIGLLFGELNRLSIRSRLLLIASAIAIALIANFLRAMFLVWIGATQDISAIDRWHDIAGYGIVVLTFLGTLALSALLGRRKVKLKGNESRKEIVRLKFSYFLIPNYCFAAAICWMAISEIAAASWYRAHEKNIVALPRWTVSWPNDAPGFRQVKIDEGVRSTLRYDEAGEAAWNVRFKTVAGDSAEKITVARCIGFFSHWAPGGSSVVRARAHRPDICLPAAGWRQISDYGVKNYSGGGGLALPFHHLVFEDERNGRRANTFFCLQEDQVRPTEPRPDLEVPGGAQPDWSFLARSRVVLNGARNLGQQILEVAFVSSNEIDDRTVETEFGKLLPLIISTDNKTTNR